MCKILVTSISGDVGNSVLKCLQNKYDLVGCDVYDYPAGYDRVNTFVKVPYAVDSGYIESLIDVCTSNSVTHFIPVNEMELRVISKNIARFSDLGIHVIIQSGPVLDICFDKYKTAQYVAQHGLDAPQSWTPDDPPVEEGMYLLKPRCSSGSKNIRKLSLDQLDKCSIGGGCNPGIY